MKKVLLIDGNNILFRSFYATSYSGVIMRNKQGFPTNALYGLINMLNKIITEEKPTHIMVALDKGKTFRHDKYESYKAGRKAMPEELKLQFPKAKEIIEAMGIRYFEIDNYEADDIIGTFASEVDRNEDFTGTIISSDKDLLQLISEDIDVKLLKTNDFIRIDKKLFRETYKVDPIHMIDLKALMGDASDHIPGVKGIGEKTAIQLLEKYTTIDNLYAHIDEIKGKTKEKLENDKENCYMSYDLATIYRKVDIDTDLEKITYKGINYEKYIELLKEFEFNSLLKKIDKENLPKNILEEKKEEEKEEGKDLITVTSLDQVEKKENYALYLEVLGYNYHKAKPLGVSIYNKDSNYFIPFDLLLEKKDFFFDSFHKSTYDLKKVLYVFNKYGLKINNCDFDSMVASYVLNYNQTTDIAVLANALSYDIAKYDSIYGTKITLKEPSLEIVAKQCSKKAKFIYETKALLLDKLNKEELEYLFHAIEMPLIFVLYDMEKEGIRIDQSILERMGQEIDEKMNILTKEIYEDAKEEFNIMSPKQLGEILFNKLQIRYPKRIKEGQRFLTNKEILEKVSNEHPIVEKILQYRTLSKLKANYVVGLINEIEEGRIHTIFNQTLTRTGRLSSEAPNLQNIPIREEFGKLIRKAFIPDDEGSILLSSDYSQIELRMFAHMSGADNLKQAFIEEKDIHTKTAADIYHVKESEVTPLMRRTAKAVNFGILYGISSFGLSEDLHTDYKTAKEFIDNYLTTYPGIKEYMEQLKEYAYKHGYVKTIMNRKRTIDELKEKNYMVRSMGERMALNTPVQGSAADILKKAMIEIFETFKEKHLKSKMLLQVHDELIFNVKKEEKEQVEDIVRDIMQNTYKLSVPLKVDIEEGTNWYEAK